MSVKWVLRPLSPDRIGIDFGDTDNVSGDIAARLFDRMGLESRISTCSHTTRRRSCPTSLITNLAGSGEQSLP